VSPIDLDAWAVATAAGRGVDDTVRTYGQVLGRRLIGTTATGPTRTSPVKGLRIRDGIVDALTESGAVYRLGESVWSKIGHVPSEGGER
jgi:hypothetical protein